MKKIYLFLLMALIFSFNQISAQEPCPDSATISNNAKLLTLSYDDPPGVDCISMPAEIRTTNAIWAFKNCHTGNNSAFYDLVTGSEPAGGTLSIILGFDGVCDYVDSVLPISDFEFLNATLKLYPNPLMNGNQLNIEFAINTSAKVYLYDVTGKLAFIDEMDNVRRKQINTSSLTNGVYFLKLDVDDVIITRKVIVMK